MCQVEMAASTGLTLLISVQRNAGVFLLETDWMFEGLKHKFQSVGKRYAPSWSALYLRLVAFELAIVRPEIAAFIPAVDGRQGLDLQGQTEQLNESVSILLIIHIFFSE